MTADDLQCWSEACEKASPGPWKPQGFSFGVGFCHGFQDESSAQEHSAGIRNAAFIGIARTAVPALIAEVRRLNNMAFEKDRERGFAVRRLDKLRVIVEELADLAERPCMHEMVRSVPPGQAIIDRVTELRQLAAKYIDARSPIDPKEEA